MWHPLKAAGTLMFSLLFIIPTLLYVMNMNKMLILNWDFFLSPSLPLSLSVMLDMNGLILMSVVIFIASNVLVFTSTYMSEDLFMPRFVALVMSFIAAMCMLVILPNLITLLIGWDGLGLTSYLLVLYYQTPKSQSAAMITAMTNRLGDILILFTIAWSLNTHWLPLQPWTSSYHMLMALALITAAMTKSAQYPFISWLPAAMAAPTPVSALVHSSTLVTAGVFILIRFFPMIENSSSLKLILLFSAALTSCVAGLAAMVECDMKKIIALSTLSQLGTMMYSLAMGMPSLTLFHLTTHALFKALLFMAAGTLIHYHHHTQDLRSFGLLNKAMPFTSSMMTVSSMALCGIPFMAGFYSKDLILEAQGSHPMNYILILVFLLATSLTSSYSMRFLINVIWAPRHTPPASMHQTKICPETMIPMLLLAQATLIVGPSLFWTLVQPENEVVLPLILKIQALLASFCGMAFGWVLNKNMFKNSAWLLKRPLINLFLTSLAFSTPLNAQATATQSLRLGLKAQKNMEGGWMEASGGQGSLLMLKLYSPKTTQSTGKSFASNIISFTVFATMLVMLWK